MVAFNPHSSLDIQQLSKAVGYSYKCMQVFRDNRIDILRQLVGNHYSENGADDKVPINLMELAINIYMQRLAANAPQADVTTDYPQLKEICTRTEISGNQLLDDMNLGRTFQKSVMGGLICEGVIKVGLNIENIDIGEETYQNGKCFADYVSLDDWVRDMTASDDASSQFEGNFYYPSLDEAEAMFPGYEFIPIDKRFNSSGEKAHGISESESQREEFRPRVRLLDIYLRKQKMVLRCSTSDDDDDPITDVLAIVDWKKRKRGPYHKLGFTEIDNNAMPVAPAMHWIDIHDLANRLFRKLGRQAERQKTVTTVQRGAEGDGTRKVEANDGDTISVDNSQAVGEFSSGGIKQETLGFLVMVKDLFSYLAGNLDALGGLGPQTETLGQDELLSASASMRIQKMQKATVAFARDVIEDIFMYMWEDPLWNPIVVKKVKGFEDVSVQVPFGPQDRREEFIKLNVKIEPYSMQHVTREAKLQGLRTVMAEFVGPLLPMMEAQGITLDLEMLFRSISKLGNISELKDIIVYTNPIHQQEPQQVSGGKPAVTTRNYTRRSIPGATNAGKSQILQQALFGGKPQNSETMSMLRPTG